MKLHKRYLTIFILPITIFPASAHDELNDTFKEDRINFLSSDMCLRALGKTAFADEMFNRWYNKALPRGLNEEQYEALLLDDLSKAEASGKYQLNNDTSKKFCKSKIMLAGQFVQELSDHITNEHTDDTNLMSAKTETSSNEQAHDECLNARDYKGCIEVKSGNSSNTKRDESCAPYTLCKPGKGNDMLGEPMIHNWPYTYYPDKQIVRYYGPISKLIVRGEIGRYIEMESIFREKRNPTQAIAPTSFNLSPKTTTCTAGYNSVDCKTSPPIDITIPGKQASPGGIIQTSHRTVIDCKDQTYAIHNDGHVVGRWKTTKGTNHQTVKSLLKSCDNIDELPLSTFDKYAGK